MRAQALGLAEALGLPYCEWSFTLALPWRALPPSLTLAAWRLQVPLAGPKRCDPLQGWWSPLVARLATPPGRAAAVAPDALTLPPLVPMKEREPIAPPELIVATGRRVIALALWLKERAPTHPAVLYVQDPRTLRRSFDHCFIPAHDPGRGPNVTTTPIVFHRVTPERLAAAAAQWQPLWASYPKPWWGLIVGGPSRSVAWHPETAQAAITAWIAAARTAGATLFATTARRTPAPLTRWLTEMVARLLPQSPPPYTGVGENPYMAILALTERRAVTSDSVSMLSETVAAPGLSFRLEVGRYRPRLQQFHAIWTNGPVSAR